MFNVKLLIMTTAIYVIAALCVLASFWFVWRTKRKCERKLQKCIDNYEESNELRNAELQGAIHRADEATAALANAKKTLKNLQGEFETLKKEFEAYMALHTDPHAEHQDPLIGGDVNVTTDFTELKKSYDELAKSYNYVSQRFENPSKTYLIRNIVKAYGVKNMTQLAKALGISTPAVCKMLKQ